MLLHSAAAGGSAEIVGLLIDKGFPPDRADRFGWTPLHYAARDGRTEAARILIERGAPLDARTVMGQTAYNVARERKMEAVAALLAEKGADKSDIRFPVLKGDYLGQKPPGDKPDCSAGHHLLDLGSSQHGRLFARWERGLLGAHDDLPGRDLFPRRPAHDEAGEGPLDAAAWASFSGPKGEDDVPFFSADGKRLYFLSRRPLPGETQRGARRSGSPTGPPPAGPSPSCWTPTSMR